MTKHKIGIDLGLTKIECAVLDSDNNIIFRERTSTDQNKGTNHIYSKLLSIYQKAVMDTDVEDFTIGIGMPGSISKHTGQLKNSAILAGQTVQSDLEILFDHAVTIENDANCFALAESTLGAAKDHAVVFGIILGTGVGGGLVIDKQLRVGPQRVAGEWGHIDLDPSNQLTCFCGKTGCVETWLSGSGLERRYRQLYDGAIVTAQEIADPNYHDTNALMSEYFDKFGQAVANLIQVIDPDCIVLGGGLSNINSLYTAGAKSIEKHLFNDCLTTPILKNKLGDSAGVVGAALI